MSGRSLYRKARPDEVADPYDVVVRDRATGRLLPMPKEPPRAVVEDSPKPRRGRPATGRQPNAAYTAKAKAQLEQAGGHRLTVNLSPDAVQAIADLQRIEGFTTAVECINHALEATASLALRRSKLKGGSR
jgi:hypothetical protein